MHLRVWNSGFSVAVTRITSGGDSRFVVLCLGIQQIENKCRLSFAENCNAASSVEWV